MHMVGIGKEMGVNTWAAFAGSDDNAVVDGDFAVTEDELQAALKALRVGGINIVAIHSHMTHENPRILFFHYWGRGSAKELANTLKGGLLAAGLSGVSTSIGNCKIDAWTGRNSCSEKPTTMTTNENQK